MTTTEYLIELIAAKRDLRAALLEKGVQTWGGLNIYPEAVDRIKVNYTYLDNDVLVCEDGARLELLGPTPKLDVSLMTSMNYMFKDNGYYTMIGTGEQIAYFTSFYLESVNQVRSMVETFEGCTALESVIIPDTSNVTNTYHMFGECESLKSVQLGLSNVDDARYMFQNCTSLTSVDLGDFSSNNTSYMFYGCESLEYLPVIDMGDEHDKMYANCTSLVDIPQINFNDGGTISQIFYGCTGLKTISNITGAPSQFSTYSDPSSSWLNGCVNIESIGEIDCSNCRWLMGVFGTASPKLVTVGGLKDYGKVENCYAGDALKVAPNLSRQSLVNIFNSLFDRKSAGYANNKIYLLQSQIEKLTSEDIAIATNKGWEVIQSE